MTNIQAFPATLQPIIQQGFLDREFLQALISRSSFRACADRVEVAGIIGEKHVIRHKDETAELTADHYASTADLNMVTARVGIASQFLQNAYTNGEQAMRSLNELAHAALRRGFKSDPSALMRPRGRVEEPQMIATDILTMALLLDAVARLRSRQAPEIDGAYNCYLDPTSARQLFSDPDFKGLFQGATSANQVFRKGMTNDFLGIRFMPTTEIHVRQHLTLANTTIRTVIITGAGALVEGDHTGMTEEDMQPYDSLVTVIDGVAMVTREPVDRLQQVIAQSWYWIGGFGPRLTDNGEFRRAVCIEHVG